MHDDERRPSGKVVSLPAAPDAFELRHLRAFAAVAEELNFGRAAARLFISQPALSRQIRALERLVGCDLLRRSTHRVELTLAGDALLGRVHRLLEEVDDAVQATRSVGGELENRMARLWEPVADLTAAPADIEQLRTACEELHAQFPPPEVDVRPVNAGGVPSLLVAGQRDLPTRLLYLHGGGYVAGSAFGHRHLAGALALAAGTGVLVPEYRLAPEHPFPAAVEDAVRAYLWLLDGGAAAEDIVVAGDSSGAGLALSLLVTLTRQQLALPAGVALLSPALDLVFADEERLQDELAPTLTIEQLRSFAVSYLGGHPPDDEVVNPLGADLSGFPPLLIQAGTGDVLVGDAHRFADRARSHGVDVRLELYPVPTHDFQIFWSFLPEAADAIEHAGRFVRERRAAPAKPAAPERSADQHR